MFQSNMTVFWKVFLPFVFAAMVGTSGWALVSVADLPKYYETKDNHKDDIKILKGDVDKVNKKVDDLQSEIVTQGNNIETKVDEINKFLRDYFSKHSND